MEQKTVNRKATLSVISQTLFSKFISQFIVIYVGLSRENKGVDQFDCREDNTNNFEITIYNIQRQGNKN